MRWQIQMRATHKEAGESSTSAATILASANRRSEIIRVLKGYCSETETRQQERKILFADLVEGADRATLDGRPEAFSRIGVDRADS